MDVFDSLCVESLNKGITTLLPVKRKFNDTHSTVNSAGDNMLDASCDTTPPPTARPSKDRSTRLMASYQRYMHVAYERCQSRQDSTDLSPAAPPDDDEPQNLFDDIECASVAWYPSVLPEADATLPEVVPMKTGKFTELEDKLMVDARNCGRTWAEIGQMLHRHHGPCRQRYSAQQRRPHEGCSDSKQQRKQHTQTRVAEILQLSSALNDVPAPSTSPARLMSRSLLQPVTITNVDTPACDTSVPNVVLSMKGCFTESEDKFIADARMRSASWTEIGLQLNRSANSCASRYKSSRQKPFTLQEDVRVAQVAVALKDASAVRTSELWSALDTELGRMAGACKTRWGQLLAIRKFAAKQEPILANETSMSTPNGMFSSAPIASEAVVVAIAPIIVPVTVPVTVPITVPITELQSKSVPPVPCAARVPAAVTSVTIPSYTIADNANRINQQRLPEVQYLIAAAERAPIDSLYTAWKQVTGLLKWTVEACRCHFLVFASQYRPFTPQQDERIELCVMQAIHQMTAVHWAQLDEELRRVRGECVVRWFVHLGIKHVGTVSRSPSNIYLSATAPSTNTSTSSSANKRARNRSDVHSGIRTVPDSSTSTTPTITPNTASGHTPQYLKYGKSTFTARESATLLQFAERASVLNVPTAWEDISVHVGRSAQASQAHWMFLVSRAAPFKPEHDLHIVEAVEAAVNAKVAVPWAQLDEALQRNRGDCVRRWWMVLRNPPPRQHTAVI